LKAGFSQSETAQLIDVHKSTVSFEIRRNRSSRREAVYKANALGILTRR